MKDLALDNFYVADSYLRTITTAFYNESRRFNNVLLYNMITIAFEKFMISWLAYYDQIATSHLPLMLYRELNPFEPNLQESLKKTAILVGSFEGICSIDGFGYRTPTDSDIETMIDGIGELREEVSQRIEAI